MSYYNYHGIIRKKILAGMLRKYEFVTEYHRIKPALLLYFEDETIYPIREHRFNEYLIILENLHLNE